MAKTSGTIERYHPVIPYKHENQIKNHIARAVSSKEYKEELVKKDKKIEELEQKAQVVQQGAVNLKDVNISIFPKFN